ncbi:MAG: hypothetical protein F6J87_12540 [Spirulina sp. SIO3F2]|nr:hypothetical protein [Spirulina sp. SIO3F2]
MFTLAYCITPLVFDKNLDEILILVKDNAVVYDLCDGQWSRFLSEKYSGMSRLKIQKLIAQLRNKKRLVVVRRFRKEEFRYDEDWCEESLILSIKPYALDSIVTTKKTNERFLGYEYVTSIDNALKNIKCKRLSNKIVFGKKSTEYRKHLRLTFQNSKKIIIIDNKLFERLLKGGNSLAKNITNIIDMSTHVQKKSPTIVKIHLFIGQTDGEGAENIIRSKFISLQEIISNQNQKKEQLRVEFMLWKELKECCLVSDLLNVEMDNGFDFGSKDIKTEWRFLPEERINYLDNIFNHSVEWFCKETTCKSFLF